MKQSLRHPAVRLEVTTDDRTVDLIEEGDDLVIRANPDPDEGLMGRFFLHDRLVIVASPGPAPPAGDGALPVILCDAADARVSWHIAKPAGTSAVVVDPVLRLSSRLPVSLPTSR